MPFSNGVNLQPSYYQNGDLDLGWELMLSDPRIKTVRIEIEPDKVQQAKGWIQQACSRNYQVIATYHTGPLGTDNRPMLEGAARWWADNYRILSTDPICYVAQPADTLSAVLEKYYWLSGKCWQDARRLAESVRTAQDDGKLKRASSDYSFQRNLGFKRTFSLNMDAMKDQLNVGDIVILPAYNRSFTINLINEWGSHNLAASDYAAAYNKAISAVRNVYATGPLIIDLPGWGQETGVAADAASGVGGNKLLDQNIVLSAHIYSNSSVNPRRGGSWPPLQKSDLDRLASAKRPCIVGEFGPGDTTGNADWVGLVRHAKSLGWPVLAWAWNGDDFKVDKGGKTVDGQKMNMCMPSWAHPTPLTISPVSGKYMPDPYYTQVSGLLSK
jgi:hypothetical protein